MDQFMSPKTTFGDELRFAPDAYAKLIWMRDRGPTEVAGYCTTATEDPLLVTDLRLIKQKCNDVHFELDPDDTVEDVERTLDMGLSPWATHNILCHSHPGNSPKPSGNDEDNFQKAFSRPNWAIMLIIAKNGSTYCRLKMNTAPGVEKLLKVTVDWSVPFGASDTKAWEEEYKAKVVVEEFDIVSHKIAVDEEPLWANPLQEKQT
ncbi:Mov34/MPN/PAD-1 family protein, partial [Candidatus Pacearchaeota archaeon]|nr:Mov34/MPN/PAD-1 family protein [Candidatus Pacearchaeota archaeon]